MLALFLILTVAAYIMPILVATILRHDTVRWGMTSIFYAISAAFLVAALSTAGANAVQIALLISAVLALVGAALSAWWSKLSIPVAVAAAIIGAGINVILLTTFYRNGTPGGARIIGGTVEAIAVVAVFFAWTSGINDRIITRKFERHIAAFPEPPHPERQSRVGRQDSGDERRGRF